MMGTGEKKLGFVKRAIVRLLVIKSRKRKRLGIGVKRNSFRVEPSGSLIHREILKIIAFLPLSEVDIRENLYIK